MPDSIENIKVAPHINASKSDGYTIYPGMLSQTWPIWFKNRKYSNIVIICDENSAAFCLPGFLTKTGINSYFLIQTESGENHKTLDSCQKIWSQMMNLHIDRKSLCINLGGGVIGDMGGFCAAAFKRGFDFVQIPTTLLAQVDASIGGKLGVDFQGLKNGIGLFKNPEAVFIDPDFLISLPERILNCAYAEMLKHALIGNRTEWLSLCEWVPSVDSMLLAKIISSVKIKKIYFDKDPYELNIRKTLNFGHTIGHAIESYFLSAGITVLHGEAVAAGLVCELYLSVVSCRLQMEVLEKTIQALVRIFPVLPLREDMFEDLLLIMVQDKKNENMQVNFTLLSDIGEPKINQFADKALIYSSLNFYLKNYHA